MADRAQAPSGLGYALVNRSALSRVLPALHRASGVERQAGFFRAIRAGIARTVPEDVDEPRVVILTPGPLSETYFEHAYLASYLGYPLVEGRDLVVQNNRVWLRSLAGLDPVDAVIRRVDDSLVRSGRAARRLAARRARTARGGPPRSGGRPQSAGLGDPREPGPRRAAGRVAPALLGEELALRGPESWWCGRPDGLSHVLAHFDELLLLPVQPSAGPRPLRPGLLSRAERDALADRVRARPGDWVGQEILAPSTMPTVGDDGALVARPVVLRTFAVADEAAVGSGRVASACCRAG